MIKSLNKLLAVTALVAALPLASHAGSYYLSASGSGNLTPEHENTIKFFAPKGSKVTTTVGTFKAATGGFPAAVTANPGLYGIDTTLTTAAVPLIVLPETQLSADKIKAKKAFGGGGSVAFGYSVPDSAASFEVSVGYDMYGTAKHKDLDADFYGEDAMRALARAALPINMGNSMAPYVGVGVGVQQIRTDADKMDAKVKATMMPVAGCMTPATANTGNGVSGDAGHWATGKLDAATVCPGFGNMISENKLKDISILGQGFAGISFEMQPEMSVFAEYSLDLAFQKPKMEDENQEKTYFERSGIKHRVAAGMKYEF